MSEPEPILDDTNPEKELVAGSPGQRNWRGIGVALLVILFICAIIATAVVILTPGSNDGKGLGTKFNLSEILFPPVLQSDPSPVWIDTKILAYKDENDTLWTIELKENASENGKYIKRKLLDSADYLSNPKSWVPNQDARFVAFSYTKYMYTRRSSLKTIHIFEILSLSHKSINNDQPVRLFRWSPKQKSTAFAFVDRNNNIWYQSDVLNDSSRTQITFTGSNDVYNGVSDWLYEEEIFENDCTMSFSDSGSKLAYYTINDTLVKKINLPFYYDYSNYPVNLPISYPKVGEVLPTIDIYVWLVDYNRTIRLIPPVEVENLKEYYLINGKWLKSGQSDQEIFAAIWSNRVQNVSFISICPVPNNFDENIITCILHYKHSYDRNWLVPATTRVDFSTNDKYFTLLPKNASDGYTYIHLASLNTKPTSQQIPRFLTSGPWEIISIVGLDTEHQILYFLAALPNPRAKHLYSVNVSGLSNSNPECLTCSLAKSDCNYVSADFSRTGFYYALSCNGPGVPKVYLRSALDNTTVLVLSNNTDYSAYINSKLMPLIRYETKDLDNGYDAVLKILLPPNFDPTGHYNTYPVVLKVYAGPGNQMAVDQWSISFDTYLVTQRNFIVVYIDGRGSGNRGSKYTAPLYHNFGTVEIEDQINAIKLFENQTNYVQRNNLAVWGWSYGGFATAHIIKQDKFSAFRCAMSVAPVTNFLYYDAAYTERYMGMNSTNDNYEGYKRTNVMSDVSAFALGKFLLAHGTGDDNVHFQNSALLIEALTKRNIQFKFMAYTNQQHSISENLLHLYTMLDNFLLDCFHIKVPEESH